MCTSHFTLDPIIRNEKHGYKKLQAVRKAVMLRRTKGTLNQNYTNILLMLLRLRQACDHPQLVHRSTSDPYEKESEETVQRLPKEARINLLNCLESSSAICNIYNNISLVMRTSALCGHAENA
ncbi:hypothetical protein F2Q69_00009444 [Brassica cretica]|uniref:SNF2 N-terminal domain-containing protein n=1 Tax=Brassica cretica TaxID=69181 RepID=A0A8S9PIE1_BRACR|nr:hypothetical protein F2Q69_00009444 [Brassica cretica]